MSKIEELIQQYCPDGVEYVKLGKVCDFITGFAFKASLFKSDGEPICKTTNIQKDTIDFNQMECFHLEDYDTCLDKYIIMPQDIVIGMSGTIKIGINNSSNKCYLNQRVGKFAPHIEYLNNKFLYYILLNSLDILCEGIIGGSVKNLSNNDVNNLEIPVPTLPVQEEIVRILDNFTTLEAELEAELDCRKRQYEYYRDKLLNKSKSENEYKRVKLGEIGRVCMCKRVLKEQTTKIGDIPFYKIGTFGKEADAFISKELYEDYKSKYSFPKKGDVLISASGTIGRSVIYDGKPAYYQDSNIVWIENDESKALNKWLFYCYQMSPWKVSTGGTISRLYNDNIANAEIPLPPLAVQERIVNVLDNFEQLCNDLGIGLPAEIAARRKQYEYYRDKLLTFKRKEA
ncbi:MAG: restriction endonuclease subunit S [Bacteroidales bacterium]|nr:restriction endonuclease subunit S [Bacteroidales bacterium]